MNDPVADMLTRIRNAHIAKHASCVVPASKLKISIATILKDEGYITDFTKHDSGPQGSFTVELRYTDDGSPAIRNLQRASRLGRRLYVGKDDIPRVLSGMGTAVMSTSKGVMTGRAARKAGVGGEVLCTIY